MSEQPASHSETSDKAAMRRTVNFGLPALIYPPAPVSSVNGNAPANTNSGMLITPPPKMGTTSTAQQPQIQPVQQPQIQATQQPQIQPVQPVAQQPVQMENGRIVYNRQYGNIPKGSYSGSTYTVKKGDTLFYIAWIDVYKRQP